MKTSTRSNYIYTIVMLLGICSTIVLYAQTSPELNLEPHTNSLVNDSPIRLQGTKRTYYQETASPYQRDSKYIQSNRFEGTTPQLNPLIFTGRSSEEVGTTEEVGTLSGNELEFSFGALNDIAARAQFYKYFDDDFISLQFAANYASSLGALGTNGYISNANSQLTRLFIEQHVNLDNETHMLLFRHLTQIEGLQELPFPTPATNTNSSSNSDDLLEHLLFLSTIQYNLNLPIASETVENLLLKSSLFVHYANHFLRLDNNAKRLERNYLETSAYVALSFTKNIQHAFDIKLGYSVGLFAGPRNIDFLLSTFFTYTYETERLILELGIGDVYRHERTPAEKNHLALPLLPKLILKVSILSNLQLILGSEGIPERAPGDVFYETNSPLPFAENIFPTLNRYFKNSATLAVSYEKYLTWTIGFINALYISPIERIVLDENQFAIKETLPVSLKSIYYTLNLETEVRIWFHPFLAFAHTLIYTAPETEDLFPTLRLQTSLTLYENILHSHFHITHFYTYEDFFVLNPTSRCSGASCSSARLSRAKNELSFRYEIQVYHSENQQVSLFVELNNIIDNKNYKSIPFLDNSLRHIKGGVHYVF